MKNDGLKRRTTRLMALFMACACVPAGADAPAWRNGLSPAQPFANVEKTDLSSYAGYFMVQPDKASEIPAGADTLKMYFPRTDLTGMAGELTVLESGRPFAVCDLAAARVSPMEREDLNFYGWGGGIEIAIDMGRAVAPDAEYSVSFPSEALKFALLDEERRATRGEVGWTFRTLDCGAYIAAGHEKPAGTSEEIGITLGRTAKQVRIELYTPDTLNISAAELAQDGKVTVSYIAGGRYEYSIDFYDAEAQLIAGLDIKGAVLAPK